MIILDKKRIVTVNILYYIPNYQNLIQEFIWQTEDMIPELYRVHKFLNFWKDNIDAIIKEILISYSSKNKTEFLKFDKELKLN